MWSQLRPLLFWKGDMGDLVKEDGDREKGETETTKPEDKKES